MFRRIIEIIKEALRSMVAYKDVIEATGTNADSVSNKMTNAFEKWRDIYINNPDWLSSCEGIKPMGKAKKACQVMAMTVLNELKYFAIPDGYNVESGADIDPKTRAGFVNSVLDNHLKPKLKDKIEQAFAMGGCVIKPYVSNGKIYFDFVMQGDFYPIGFDDDGNIIDIAFIDQFIEGKWIFTRVERHTLGNNKVVIENKAYRATHNANDPKLQELGIEIELASVSRWAQLEPVVEIEDINKQLFGYFKVASANNIDLSSPLGISIFANSIGTLERIDKQATRLDWEYEGSELAVDADMSALVIPNEAARDGKLDVAHLPHSKRRLFRARDTGDPASYEVFNPTLRDDNYLRGYNALLLDAEDQMGLSRGSLGARVDFTTKTATEEIIAKQMAYSTVVYNQGNLEKCLEGVNYAIEAYMNLYAQELGVPNGEFEIIINWNDSILTDRDSEFNTKRQLVDMNIMSRAELRAWYFNEPLGVASEQVQKIIDANRQNFNADLFGNVANEQDGSENNTNNE